MALNEPDKYKSNEGREQALNKYAEENTNLVCRGCVLAQMVLARPDVQKAYFEQALKPNTAEVTLYDSARVTIKAGMPERMFSALKLAYDPAFNKDKSLTDAQRAQVTDFLKFVKGLEGDKTYGYLAQAVMFYEKAASKAGTVGGISDAKDALGATKQQATSDIVLGGRERMAGQPGPPAEGVYLILGNEAAKAYNKLVLAEIAAQQVQAPSASEATPPPTQVPREAAPATVEGMPPVASSMTQFTPSAQPVNTLLENYVELPDVPGNVAKKADILASLVLGFNSLGANEPGLGSNMIMGGMSAAVYDKQSTYVFAGEAVTPLTITPEVARATAERLKTLNREDPRIKPDLDLLDAITQLDAIK